MDSFAKCDHVKLQREATVLSVNRFACASWYSMNVQINEFQTVVNCHKIFTVCAATGDQSTVHKESEPGPVPSIEIESYILAQFPNTLTLLGKVCKKEPNCVLSKDKW